MKGIFDGGWSRQPHYWWRHPAIACSLERRAVYAMWLDLRHVLGRRPTLGELARESGLDRGLLGKMVRAWEAAGLLVEDSTATPRASASSRARRADTPADTPADTAPDTPADTPEPAAFWPAERTCEASPRPADTPADTPASSEAGAPRTHPHVRAVLREGAGGSSLETKRQKDNLSPDGVEMGARASGERERVPAAAVKAAAALVVTLDPEEPRLVLAGDAPASIAAALVKLGAVEASPGVWEASGLSVDLGRLRHAFQRLVAGLAEGPPTSAELRRAGELARRLDGERVEVVFRAEPPSAVRALLRRVGMRPERVQLPDMAGYVWRWTSTEPATAHVAAAVVRRMAVEADAGQVVDIDRARAAARPVADVEPSKASVASARPVKHSPAWAATLAELRAVVGEDLYRSTFAGLSLVAVDVVDADGDGNETWTAATGDEMASLVVGKSYLGVIQACAERATGRAVTVTVRHVGEVA